MTQGSEIALAEAISAVRRELNRAAMVPGDPHDIIGFRYGNVEIELEVEVAKEVEASAGVRFWVISGDTKASGTVGNTNRVKITLLPYDRRTVGVPEGVLDNREYPRAGLVGNSGPSQGSRSRNGATRPRSATIRERLDMGLLSGRFDQHLD